MSVHDPWKVWARVLGALTLTPEEEWAEEVSPWDVRVHPPRTAPSPREAPFRTPERADRLARVQSTLWHRRPFDGMLARSEWAPLGTEFLTDPCPCSARWTHTHDPRGVVVGCNQCSAGVRGELPLTPERAWARLVEAGVIPLEWAGDEAERTFECGRFATGSAASCSACGGGAPSSYPFTLEFLVSWTSLGAANIREIEAMARQTNSSARHVTWVLRGDVVPWVVKGIPSSQELELFPLATAAFEDGAVSRSYLELIERGIFLRSTRPLVLECPRMGYLGTEIYAL